MGAAAVRVDRPAERHRRVAGHLVQRRLAVHLVEGHAGELGRPDRPDEPGQPAHAGQRGRVLDAPATALPISSRHSNTCSAAVQSADGVTATSLRRRPIRTFNEFMDEALDAYSRVVTGVAQTLIPHVAALTVRGDGRGRSSEGSGSGGALRTRRVPADQRPRRRRRRRQLGRSSPTAAERPSTSPGPTRCPTSRWSMPPVTSPPARSSHRREVRRRAGRRHAVAGVGHPLAAQAGRGRALARVGVQVGEPAGDDVVRRPGAADRVRRLREVDRAHDGARGQAAAGLLRELAPGEGQRQDGGALRWAHPSRRSRSRRPRWSRGR